MTTGSTDKWLFGPYFYASAYGEGVHGFRRKLDWSGDDEQGPRRHKLRWSKREIFYDRVRKVHGEEVHETKTRTIRVPQGNPEPRPRVRPPHDFQKTWTEYYLEPVSGSTWEFPRDFPTSPAYLVPATFAADAGGAIPTIADPSWGADDDYKLLDKLRTRIQGSGFNLASFLGAEGHDTLAFIASTASRINRALLAVKKGRLRQAVSVLRADKNGFLRRKHVLTGDKEPQLEVYRRAISEFAQGSKSRRDTDWRSLSADNWLEFQLAAVPLLGDLKAAVEQLAHRFEIPPKASYRARRELRVVSHVPAGCGWEKAFTCERKSIVAYVQEPPSMIALSGILDPEVVLWNALPLSFVSDWIIPIGDWLDRRAWASHISGTFVTSFKRWHEYENVLTMNSNSSYPNPVYTNRVRGTGGSFVRTVSTSLSVPLPSFTPLGKILSWSRAATAVALVAAFRY